MNDLYVLSIDEFDGSLWKIPQRALKSHEGGVGVLEQTLWKTHLLGAKSDSLAFLTAETIYEITPLGVTMHTTSAVTGPSHCFHGVDGSVVYVRCIFVDGTAWGRFGGSFVWPLSFEQHNLLRKHRGLEFKIPEDQSGRRQRPSPKSFRGATLVTDFCSLTPSERAFYASAPVAPYIFDDCGVTLEKYWRATRHHKDAAPSRVAIRSRLRRDAERRKIDSVTVLLEKSNDPLIERNVFKNARTGMRVLTDLMKKPATFSEEGDVGGSSRRDFFGVEGIPSDLQGAILHAYVDSVLRMPNPSDTIQAFCAIRLVCKDWSALATLFSNQLIAAAVCSLYKFVIYGRPMSPDRMLCPASWTYRELGCSAEVLLGLDTELHPGVVFHLLRKRRALDLLPSVCVERARTRRVEPAAPPARLLSLFK